MQIDTRDLTAIKERLQLLEMSVAHLDEMVLITSPELPEKILYVNPAFERITGYSLEQAVGRTPRMLQGEKTCRAALARIRLALERKQPVREQIYNYTRSGKPYLIDMNIVPVLNDAGHCTHFAALERDITAERAMSEKLQLAADALNNTVEGVIILDARGRTVQVNRAFTTITGYTQAQVLGKQVRFDASQQGNTVFDWIINADPNEKSRQREVWTRRRDGRVFPALASTSTVCDQSGRITHHVVVFMDITERRKTERQLTYQSDHDALTGLPNRFLLQRLGEQSIARTRRLGGHMALLFLDIDHFKNVNDSLGHQSGDRLLEQVSARLLATVRQTDTVARLGGDEFTILLEGLSSSQSASDIASKILAALRDPLELAGQRVYVTASIGICCFPGDGSDFATLMHNADLAMYNAKRQGRNTFQFYADEMNVSTDNLALRSGLHQALERQEFRLHYQPFIDLESGRITGVEALIRWHQSELGVIPPDDFIPLAEETGLILPIGDWVLREALGEIHRLKQAGHGDLRMAVNLSARQFQQTGLVERVAELLAREGLQPGTLELEITETMVMHRVEQTTDALAAFHGLGVSVALDDFGTGYSSLQYLKDFRLDYLKIDKSFVDGIPDNPGDMAIIRTIIAMAKSLGIKVIAEGVETREQLNTLRALGCQEAQGYFISMPLQAEDLRWLLDNHPVLSVPRLEPA